MQFLDKTGVGTLWSMCKTKFALAGHTHNSLAAVGNEQISATAYGSGLHFKPYYVSGGPTTYGNILEYTSTNTGGGQLAMEWTGSQTKNDGTDSNVGRVYYRSKRDVIDGWTKWMTLAYTNDIPDVSNLCRFNFVNSISECKSDRINFLLGFDEYMIDISDFDAYPDGTILIISISVNSAEVKHNSGRWFCDGDNVSAYYTENIYKERIKLVTKYAGFVYFYGS